MKKILINGKKQYICLRNKENNTIYCSGAGTDDGPKDSPFKTSTDNLNLNNPFDMWDSVYLAGTDEIKIIEDLKGLNLKKWEVFYFTDPKEVEKFIGEKESIERKQLIEKYKDKSVLEIPLGDLKKMGIESPIC